MATDNWTQQTFFTEQWTDSSNWSLGLPTSSEDAFIGTNVGNASVANTGIVNVASIATSTDDQLFIESGGDVDAADGTGPNQNAGTIKVTNGSLIVGNSHLGAFVAGNGTIELAATSANADAFLTVENAVFLEGNGNIEMAPPASGSSNAIFGEAASAEIENISDDISGTGTIFEVTFINQGTVESNDSLGAGVLDIYGSAQGGSFTNSSGATVSADDGGTVRFGADGDNSLITNQGIIQLVSSGDATRVQIAGNVTINQKNGSSSGFIDMAGTNAAEDSIVSDGNPATLTLVGGSLDGGGVIGDANLTLINQSQIFAQAGTLILDTGGNTITNEGFIGSVGGILGIESPVNNSSGLIAAEGGEIFILAPVTGTVFIDSNSGLVITSDITSEGGHLRFLIGSVSGNVEFAGVGELELTENVANGGIGGQIENAAAGDEILSGAFKTEAGEHAVWDQTSAGGGTLSIYAQGNNLYTLDLAGTYNSLNFVVTTDDFSTTTITVQNTPSYAEISGNNDEWILSDGAWVESAGPGSHPSGYSVALTGDWTGDGTDGILWFNPTTGDADEWQLSNTQWSATVDLGTHPTNATDGASYQIAGTDAATDFTGNGIDDVLLTSPNSDGSIATDIWELGSNGQWIHSISPGSHPAGYTVAATGDWTGSGTDGILWYNASNGDTDEWQLSGGQWSGSVDLGSHPGSGWTIAGVGDFFANGRDDVLWTNASGGSVQTDIWELASNGQWMASVSPGSHPAGSQVVAVGDATGTGTSDIIWYNPTTGDTDEWLINNGQWSSSIDFGIHPGLAQIAGVGDFNGDGTKDILWHSPS